MTESFARFRCWNIPDVQTTVFGDIASLGLDADAIFLAAHSSLQIHREKGIDLAGAERETAVLRALDTTFGQKDANTIIAITGPSGSGKSHLVRWVRSHLSETDERYHLIYVPREVATLRELLGRVLNRMPGKESDLVKAELDKAVGQKSPEQLAEELLDKLRSVMTFEIPDSREGQDPEIRRFLLGSVDPDSLKREKGISDLLLAKPIRDHLLRGDGTINRIVQSLRGKRRGGEETPEFGEADWPVKKPGVLTHVERSQRTLLSYLEKNPAGAARLMNEARNRAVAETLGMRPGVDLGEVFAKTRRRLRADGRDLVLLFEDLAQFGLFDGELFNQLGLQPSDELAPVRAIFAITDGKFMESVPDTVRSRITDHFRVAELESDDGNIQLEEFAARYLNIARLGRERILAAWAKSSPTEREEGTWVPNACTSLRAGQQCPHFEECWASFGHTANFGLYPYNRVALKRWSKLRGKVTPRVVVDELVREFLIEAEPRIAQGTFPDQSAQARFDVGVDRGRETIVQAKGLTPTERDRLWRARVIWADGNLEDTGVRRAFDLPDAPGVAVPDLDLPPEKAPEAERKPNPLGPLYSWDSPDADDAKLPESEAVWYREHLTRFALGRLDLVSSLIDIGAEGEPQAYLNGIFYPNSFDIHDSVGEKPGPRRLKFELPRNSHSVAVLSAARWFWDHGHWDPDAPDRRWDFPDDMAYAQIAFEEFIDGCVSRLEDAVVEGLATQNDVAADGLVLRACALMAMGASPQRSPRTLDWVFQAPEGGIPSTEWAPVVRAAQEILSAIQPQWIALLASARQSDAGGPLAVDVARLLPAVQRAMSDPIRALNEHQPSAQHSAWLAQVWGTLRQALSDGIPAESARLRQAVQSIGQALGTDGLQGLVETAGSTGVRASEKNLFRPTSKWPEFRTALSNLRNIGDEEIRSWIGYVHSPGSADVAKANQAVMAAQSWARRATVVASDIELIEECLTQTGEYAKSRIVAEIGATPEEEAHRVAKILQSLIDKAQSVFDRMGAT